MTSALLPFSYRNMATAKIASLVLRTLAKPIANKLKARAKNHEGFREGVMGLAQFMHRTEMRMRTSLLGEVKPAHIRPLNDAKAIDTGANFISESFLFATAAALILGETYRSKAKEDKRRDNVAESIERLQRDVKELGEKLERDNSEIQASLAREKQLEQVMGEIVAIGLKGGWLADGPDHWLEQAKKSVYSLSRGNSPAEHLVPGEAVEIAIEGANKTNLRHDGE